MGDSDWDGDGTRGRGSKRPVMAFPGLPRPGGKLLPKNRGWRSTVKRLENCPICGSSRVSYAYSAPTMRKLDQRAWSVSKCLDCEHQFVNPQPTWEELAPYYSEKYVAYDPMHGAQTSDDEEIERAKRTRNHSLYSGP